MASTRTPVPLLQRTAGVAGSSPLDHADIEALIREGLAGTDWRGRRVAVVIPDATRTAPLRVVFPALASALASARHVDVVIALGTHPAMTAAAIDAMLGLAVRERVRRFPNLHVHNHRWDDPGALELVGVIDAATAARLSEGLLVDEVPVRINALVQAADHVVLFGPVFPHEVAGFSGGAKYLFPGVAGAEIIDFTHWLGALSTSMATIGVADTPVRRVIHHAASLVTPPVTCLTMVLRGDQVHGAWYGEHHDAFAAAAALSAELNITWLERPAQRVLSIPSTRYPDLWTAAKAMYKTEPVVADAGEIVVYAPWLREVSITHGELIQRVGYHVRDYFVAQAERFRGIPGAILAHSTHVRGAGGYDAAAGVERARIRVTLATGIGRERTLGLGLGYRDPACVDPESWAGRPDTLVVRDAGERLYRVRPRSVA